jgi:hypothetical protein
MARHQHRHRVGRTRPRYGPRRRWLADASGNLRVRRCFTRRNALQFSPNPRLKHRASKVQGYRHVHGRRLDLSANHGRPGAAVIFTEDCVGKPLTKVGLQRGRIIAKRNQTDSRLRVGDEDIAERTGVPTPSNGCHSRLRLRGSINIMTRRRQSSGPNDNCNDNPPAAAGGSRDQKRP